MNLASLKSLSRRPHLILVGLLVLAVAAFAGVNRLVNRFREQEKALARHLYERGALAQNAGNPEAALGDFRAALSYSHDNSQYQLSLARALRDTGRTAEAETYLIGLWERTPQEGSVNLALGRLFAREQLVEFLEKHHDYPQAQAELITMASSLPGDSGLWMRVADLFARVQDYDHALGQYQAVLRTDPNNHTALFGAAQAAFQLGRYRTAQLYLESAGRADP